MVNAEVLAEVAARASTSAPCLRLGKGEDASGGRAKPSILADAMEAVIAAVYLDGGLDAARDVVLRAARGAHRASGAAGPGGGDYKTRLQELAAQRFDQLPRYQVRDEGPDHAKRFFATVLLGGEPYGDGRGPFEEAGRAGRGARRVGAAAGRGRGSGVGRRARTGPIEGGRMPELPEVEVVRRDLETEVVGKKIKSVEVDGMRSIRRHQQPQAVHRARSTATRSPASSGAGSTSSCKLDGDDVLDRPPRACRASCCGRRPRARPMPKHTHVVITFTQGGQLRFVDPRTFGEMFVDRARRPSTKQVDELAHLGLDPLETAMSWELLRRAARRSATRS